MKPITLSSTLSKKDIYLTMKNLTNTNADAPLFVGTITEDGFSVVKYRLFPRNMIFSRNVLDPQFDAVVTENNNGTKITIKASLRKWNKIGFFIMGVLILGIAVYFIVKAILTATLEPLAIAIVVLLWEALINLIFAFIFTTKAKRIIKILKKHLT